MGGVAKLTQHSAHNGSALQSYTELFESRGSAYDIAMRRYPHARDAEFKQAVLAGTIQPGMVVGDVPAGGRYIAPHLPPGCTCLEHEPCASFADAENARKAANPASGKKIGGQEYEPVRLHGAEQAALLPLPWRDGMLDVVISLAGVHHLEDKRPLFAEMRRVTRPGGRLVLSDVTQGSAPALFLDGFVGSTNSTGHEGVFLSAHTLDELQDAGWSVSTHRQEAFHWVFDSRAAMADFCRWLFDICKVNQQAISAAIESRLGTDRLPDGRIGMRWSLTTITATNPQ